MAPERRTEVTLDSVHSAEAPLIADLERRLGGRVLHHEVKEIDYVRDTMVVEVRYHLGWPTYDPHFAPGPLRQAGPSRGGPPHGGPPPRGPHNQARP
jgi:hypothetical protein